MELNSCDLSLVRLVALLDLKPRAGKAKTLTRLRYLADDTDSYV